MRNNNNLPLNRKIFMWMMFACSIQLNNYSYFFFSAKFNYLFRLSFYLYFISVFNWELNVESKMLSKDALEKKV